VIAVKMGKGSYLNITPEMRDFANELLSNADFKEADGLSWDLAQGTKRMKMDARMRLMEIVKSPPKRPLEYARHEIQYLPQSTRNSIRYLGDYIDLLVKACAFEVTKNPRCKETSLNGNLQRLSSIKHCVPSQLIENLRRYNALFYNPAKHDFSTPPPDREHHFTSIETIYLVFLSMKLADDIKKISPLANLVSLDKESIQEF
jgi:hypothetical protein